MARPKNPDPTRRVTMYVKESTMVTVEALAKKAKMSPAQYVARWLESVTPRGETAMPPVPTHPTPDPPEPPQPGVPTMNLLESETITIGDAMRRMAGYRRGRVVPPPSKR